MSVFRVPSRHGLAPRAVEGAMDGLDGLDGVEGLDATDARGATDAARAATVMMPPDVVARPGEGLDEALGRALADGRPTDGVSAEAR